MSQPPHVQKDIRVEVKVKNNLILKRMEEQNIDTVAELCRQINASRTADEPNIHQAKVGFLINMKEPARKKNGEWSEIALRLSAFFRCMPEDLFSEPQQYNALQQNRSHAEVAYTEIQQLTARSEGPVTPELALQASQLRTAISQALQTLTPREERVLRLRYGFETGETMTAEEIGQQFGVTNHRILQIEAKALRKLKHPSRTRPIREAGFKRDYVHKEPGKGGQIIEHEVTRLDDEVLKAL